jgi:hypothetical protein
MRGIGGWGRGLGGALAVLLATSVLVVAGGEQASPAPTGLMDEWDVAVLPLANRGIAYDDHRDVVLVGVDATVPVLGNHLVEVDPRSGAVGRTLAVGDGPADIELTDDGSTAYVSLTGSPTVVVVDLDTFVVVRRIDMGRSSNTRSTLTPRDVQPMPGASDTVLVARGDTTLRDAAAVFDGATRRPVTTPYPHRPHELVLSTTPGEVYASGGVRDEYLFRLEVTEDGVRVVDVQSGLLGLGSLTLVDGLLHSGSGRVVDPVAEQIVGTYGRNGAMYVDEEARSTYILGSDEVLTRHDSTTLEEVARRAVPRTGTDLVGTDAGVAVGDGDVVELVGEGVTGAAFALPTGPASFLDGEEAQRTELVLSSLVAAPDGSVAYGTTRASDDDHPNAVVEIDPATGLVQRSVTVGSRPVALAVSDDGSRLVLGHEDATYSTEVDVASFEVARTVPQVVGTYAAEVVAIAPFPGDPDRYAVVLEAAELSSRHGVAMVDGGSVLPQADTSSESFEGIAFTADGSELQGGSDDGNNPHWVTYDVSPQGLGEADWFGGAMGGTGRLLRSGGRMYTSRGDVVDPAGPARLGGLVESGRRVALLPEADRAFVVTWGSQSADVLEVQMSTMALVRRHTGSLPSTANDAAIAGGHLLVAMSEGTLARMPVGEQPATVPQAPVSIDGTSGDGRATVRWLRPPWDGNSPITGYRIYHVRPATGVFEVVATAGPDALQAEVPGLENGQAHRLTVLAVNAVGESRRSDEFLARPLGPPSAPPTTTATPGDDRLTVAWGLPANSGGRTITGYRIYVDGALATEVPATPRTVVLDGLVDGKRYEVRVSAVNALGEGPKGPTAVARPRPAPVVPSAPLGIAVVPGDERATVSWTSPEDDGGDSVDGYTVYVDGAPVAELPRTARDHIVTGLVNETTYAFTVTATNDVGESPPSEAVEATPQWPATTFSDVPVTHPFFRDVEWAAAEGITTGYADGTFRPAGVVTRQSMAAFLHRLAGAPPVSAPATATFRDVGPNHPFFDEVEWVAGAGIAGGYADGTYRPSATVTRQSMAAFLFRMAGSPGGEAPGPPSFFDVGPTHPFFAEVEWAAGEGITTGYVDGTFRPSSPVTRAATAAFLKRLVEGPGVDL